MGENMPAAWGTRNYRLKGRRCPVVVGVGEGEIGVHKLVVGVVVRCF